jgi:hypothetical protein
VAHKEQKEFCLYVKNLFPERFIDCLVLDCGSLDLNGNNRFLFDRAVYIGIDIVNGPNVDVVGKVSDIVGSEGYFSIVISTEMLEHDIHFPFSLLKMMEVLKHNGLMILTCATEGRQEHGTHKNLPECSPATNSYYKNITESDIKHILDVDREFIEYEFQVNEEHKDLYFWGVKK